MARRCWNWCLSHIILHVRLPASRDLQRFDDGQKVEIRVLAPPTSTRPGTRSTFHHWVASFIPDSTVSIAREFRVDAVLVWIMASSQTSRVKYTVFSHCHSSFSRPSAHRNLLRTSLSDTTFPARTDGKTCLNVSTCSNTTAFRQRRIGHRVFHRTSIFSPRLHDNVKPAGHTP